MTRSMADDEPQFQELSGDAVAKAAAEYRRVWGEDMPTADSPDTSDDSED